MAVTNRDRVGDGLHLLGIELGLFIDQRITDGSPLGSQWKAAYPNANLDSDVSAQTGVVLDYWDGVFRDILHNMGRTLVHEVREWRNRWAHSESFTHDDAYRALDTIELLLKCIDGKEASAINGLKSELATQRPTAETMSSTRPSLHFSTAPADPADTGEATTSTDKGYEGWSARFLSSELDRQLAETEELYSIFSGLVTHRVTAAIPLSIAGAAVKTYTGELVASLDSVVKAADVSTVSKVVNGPPSDEAKQLISAYVAGLLAPYVGMMQWSLRLRSMPTPSNCEELFTSLAALTDAPVADIASFVKQLSLEARRVGVARMVGVDEKNINARLVFELDPATLERATRAKMRLFGNLGDESSIVRFMDDEAGYAEWLRTHPKGYVLNCAREPQASYLPLHRATCYTISGKPTRGDTWTVAYMKVCAESTSELDSWAKETTGGTPSRCRLCHP